MKQTRAGAVLLLFAVFAIGVLTGGGAVAFAERGDRGGEHHRHGPDGYLRYLARSLDLSAAQQDSVRAIVQRHRAAMDSVWTDVRPRFETLRRAVRSEIRAQLTPDQQEQFDEQEKRREMEKGHGRQGSAPRQGRL